jgi:hypothetical protein
MKEKQRTANKSICNSRGDGTQNVLPSQIPVRWLYI